MEKIVSLCKRRGFVFPGSELYGGLRGSFDLGPLGVELARNIKQAWWNMFARREDMYGLDAAIIMNAKVWEASGHTGAGFADPMVEDTKTGERFRADHVLKDHGVDAEGMTLADMDAVIAERKIMSPKGNAFSPVRQFNLMFETRVGATAGEEGKVYLRPETAQGIFVNFKNVMDSTSPKLPFGIAQIGKAFRNEIAPREFLFRTREFEQMEIEYFIRPETWQESFDAWCQAVRAWFTSIGLAAEDIREYEVPEADLAHYSKRTIDFEYNFPGKGFGELVGLAYRTDFDLKNHAEHSGTPLVYVDPDGTKLVPHVIEPSFGVERALMAVLAASYREDTLGGETRTYLALPTHLAPYRACVSPLLKNKPELVAKAREVFAALQKQFGNIAWDDNGNIGKRYRRHDEIGTPYCIVIDFDTLEQDTVTVRARDTGEQTRVAISALAATIL